MWSTAPLPASSRLVPGYGETLRINGRLRVHDNIATLDVEEALLHCAKAIMRSELWTARGTPEPCDGAAVPAVAAFLADAPFVVLVSTDADGHADASPKGDPPGLIRQIDDTTIAIADRPGNRRTDTLHNLMDEPRIALLAMQPGSHYVAEIRGTARVCTDDALLESMRLRNRTPKVALLIDVEHREASQRARPVRRRPLEPESAHRRQRATSGRHDLGRPCSAQHQLRHRSQGRATARQQDGARGRCRLRLPDQPLSARPRRPDGTTR